MKWSKFIQDDNKFLKDKSPPSKLNTSKSRISSSGRQLALRSIEKAKADSTVYLNKHNISTSSINQNDLKMKPLVSKLSYRPPKKQFLQEYESSPNFVGDVRFKNGEWSELQQIVQRFSKELSEFIKNFMDKIDAMRNTKEFREEVAKRISHCTSDIISKCIDQLPKLELRNSPLRKSFSCVENNMVVGLKEKEGSDKKKTRVLMFKNEKVEEKNNFNRIESTFNQMNRILQNQKPPKFMRTSKIKRADRSGDSSAEDVMEKSLYDSRKSYKSRIKSKDVLYNISKILNQ